MPTVLHTEASHGLGGQELAATSEDLPFFFGSRTTISRQPPK